MFAGEFSGVYEQTCPCCRVIDGEKLSQSTADDVGALVNLGVITYLTQLLDFGFFHAVSLFITCRLPSPYVSLP